LSYKNVGDMIDTPGGEGLAFAATGVAG
jgi:hypothetical protein